MKKYIIRFDTKTGRTGYAVVCALTLELAHNIIINQGLYSSEGYTFIDAIDICESFEPYKIILEGATGIPTNESSTKSRISKYKPVKEPEFIMPIKSRRTDYLYDAIYVSPIDYIKGFEFYKNTYLPEPFGCTSIKKDNLLGRNYDWEYNNDIEFVIKMPSTEDTYASLGVAKYNAITPLTIEDKDLYEILPFLTVDGVNEYGVGCSINVVPGNEEGWVATTGTIPLKEHRVTLCMKMVPRYVLDKFKSAKEAVDYIKDYVSIYCPKPEVYHGYEIHCIIADENNSYILEGVNNELKIIENAKVITNFRLYGTQYDEDGTIVYGSVSPYGAGIERFNIVINKYNDIVDVDSMLNLLTNNIKYTNTYTLLDTDNKWLSEFVGNYDGYTLTVLDIINNPSKFNIVLDAAKLLYLNRNREDGLTWLTVHTSVYDLNAKTLTLVSLLNNNKVYKYTL